MASGKVDNLKEQKVQQKQEDLNLSRSLARMNFTLRGKPEVAQDKVLKFVTFNNSREQNVNDAVTRSVDLVRAMAVLEGFKRSISNTIKSMKVDPEDLGMFVYQMMESVRLAVVDPARHVSRAAMKYIDIRIRSLTQDAGQIAMIFQNMVKSINLKTVDPDEDITIAKEAFIEKMKFAEANRPEGMIGE